MTRALATTVVSGLTAALLAAALPAQVPEDPVAVSPVFTERAARRGAFRDRKALAAIDAGVRWLLDHQDDAGFWDCDGFMKGDPEGQRCDGAGNPANDIGVTGLALLALLGQADNVHRDAVRRAADWLERQQQGRTGLLRNPANDFVYSQAIGALALVEASALLDNGVYRDAAAAAIRYLDDHRNPGAAWRYQRRDGESDVSVTSWCVVAYCAATHAGIEVRAEAVAEALAWAERLLIVRTGHSGYANRNEASARKPGDHFRRFPVENTHAMTAAALHMRAAVGAASGGRLDRAALALLAERLPSWEPKKIDFYYWFHGSEAVAAAADRGMAKVWYAALVQALVPSQRQDGASLGSWDPVGPWGEDGGRVYSTALAVLALSSPFRLDSGDVGALVPDEPPLRRVHAELRLGHLGGALDALAKVPEAEKSAAHRAAIRRLSWFADARLRFCARVVEHGENSYEGTASRYLRLADLADVYADTEPGRKAAAAVQDMLGAAGVRAEIEAERALEAALDGLEAGQPPKNARKRAALRKRLEKILESYPGSTAAKEAAEWLARL